MFDADELNELKSKLSTTEYLSVLILKRSHENTINALRKQGETLEKIIGYIEKKYGKIELMAMSEELGIKI